MAVDFAETISVLVMEFGAQLIKMKETPCRSIQSLFNSVDIETLNKGPVSTLFNCCVLRRPSHQRRFFLPPSSMSTPRSRGGKGFSYSPRAVYLLRVRHFCKWTARVHLFFQVKTLVLKSIRFQYQLKWLQERGSFQKLKAKLHKYIFQCLWEHLSICKFGSLGPRYFK